MASSGLKLDLHNHTYFSSDAVQSPGELLAAAKQRGLDCIAITDHNTVRGGVEGAALAADNPALPRVIPGVELATQSGEIVGLYVDMDIPPLLSLEAAIAAIKDQGGVVYLPHPFDKVRRGAVKRRWRAKAAAEADIIEIANGRSLSSRAATKAAALAAELDKPAGAGSDAHRVREVGTAFVVVDQLPTRQTLVDLVARGRVEYQLCARDCLANCLLLGLAALTRWRHQAGDKI